MAASFKAQKIRTSAIVGSGSFTSSRPTLLIYSSSVADASGDLADTGVYTKVGKDAFLFVSGTVGGKGTTGVSAFGGDVVISGTIYNGDGTPYSVSGGTPAGSNGQIQFNDAGAFAGHDGLVYNKNTATLTVGNLVVTGAITTITTSNLVVSDPVIYIASGSLSSNTNGGIAIASGSSVTHQSLVFGRVANDTWGAGRLDVSGGTVTDLTSMTPVAFRAASVELGSNTAYVSSSANDRLVLYGGTNVQVTGSLFGSSAASFAGNITGSNALLSGDLAVNGGDITSTALNPTLYSTSNNASVDIGYYANTFTFGDTSTGTGMSFNVGQNRSGNFTLNLGSGGGTGQAKVANIVTGGGLGSLTTVNIGSTSGNGTTNINTPKVLIPGELQVTGSLMASNLTGSLTRLVNGTSYLVAGSNVTITTGSTGQVTISASGGTAAGSANEVQFNSGGGTFEADPTFSYDSAGSRLTVQNITANGDVAIVGGFDVNGGYLNTSQSSFSLLETIATTVAFAKAATSLSMGVSTGVTAISGSVQAPNGISGSLTQLSDGRSYLVAGSNVTITSASNGQVTISSAGGGGSGTNYWIENGANRIYSTGSVAINAAGTAQSFGTDQVFYVAGTVGGKQSGSGVSTIAGDFVVSGSTYITGSTSLLSVGKVELSTDSSNDFYLNNTLPGKLSYFGVTTTEGVTTNFLRVRPNSVPQNTLVSFLQGLGGHNTVTPLGQTDTNFFVGGKIGSIGGASRGTAVFAGDLVVSGSAAHEGTVTMKADILPDSDRTRNLGTPNLRWANIYTGDLHLRNERGDYTLIEEEDCLTIRFNKTGKRYRFVLERAPEFDEDPIVR